MTTEKQKIIYIHYNDEIGAQKVKALTKFCMDKLVKHTPDTLYFLFASPGGEVDAGVTFYNFLKTLPQKIIMHNMSSVESIGVIVFLAGQERYACPHTSFLFHSVKNTPQKEESLDLKKIEEMESKIKTDQNKIALIISENSSIKKEEMSELFDQGESKSEEFAKEKGLVHDIRNIQLKDTDLLFNFSFK